MATQTRGRNKTRSPEDAGIKRLEAIVDRAEKAAAAAKAELKAAQNAVNPIPKQPGEFARVEINGVTHVAIINEYMGNQNIVVTNVTRTKGGEVRVVWGNPILSCHPDRLTANAELVLKAISKAKSVTD